ncbi:hypothetical protein GCM10010385_11570 [Streptomyces geysiriensis]|nr:hypothetical protein GCM10010385_11570 [Streptomyces geysiriensis]
MATVRRVRVRMRLARLMALMRPIRLVRVVFIGCRSPPEVVSRLGVSGRTCVSRVGRRRPPEPEYPYSKWAARHPGGELDRQRDLVDLVRLVPRAFVDALDRVGRRALG